MKNITRCKQRVHSGRRDDLGGHPCGSAAGHGPGGEYCKAHARQFDTTPPTLELWSRELAFFDYADPMPKRVLVREISPTTFIDHRGRRHARKSQYFEYHSTKAEAVEATRKHLLGKLRSYEAGVRLCTKALARISSPILRTRKAHA
jgi:hypothetical protein